MIAVKFAHCLSQLEATRRLNYAPVDICGSFDVALGSVEGK